MFVIAESVRESGYDDRIRSSHGTASHIGYGETVGLAVSGFTRRDMRQFDIDPVAGSQIVPVASENGTHRIRVSPAAVLTGMEIFITCLRSYPVSSRSGIRTARRSVKGCSRKQRIVSVKLIDFVRLRRIPIDIRTVSYT